MKIQRNNDFSYEGNISKYFGDAPHSGWGLPLAYAIPTWSHNAKSRKQIKSVEDPKEQERLSKEFKELKKKDLLGPGLVTQAVGTVAELALPGSSIATAPLTYKLMRSDKLDPKTNERGEKVYKDLQKAKTTPDKGDVITEAEKDSFEALV